VPGTCAARNESRSLGSAAVRVMALPISNRQLPIFAIDSRPTNWQLAIDNWR
jgi:hypothetical protein